MYSYNRKQFDDSLAIPIHHESPNVKIGTQLSLGFGDAKSELEIVTERLWHQLKEGVEIANRLSPFPWRYFQTLKQLAHKHYQGDLFENSEIRESVPTAVMDAIIWAAKNGFEITNVAGRYSEYEPPNVDWRPFVVNTKSHVPSHNLFTKVQTELFARVFGSVHGVYLFPAQGLDAAYLHSQNFITVSPSNRSTEETKRSRHIKEDITCVSDSQLNDVIRSFPKATLGPSRVLLCKGLQNLMSSTEILNLADRFVASHIVVMATACSGLARHSEAVPYPDQELETTIEKTWQNRTKEFFTDIELTMLEKLHAFSGDNYAWKAGHFPATAICIYERTLNETNSVPSLIQKSLF